MKQEYREGTAVRRAGRGRRAGRLLALLTALCLAGGLAGCELEVHDHDHGHHHGRDYDDHRDHDRHYDGDRHHD